MENIDEGMFPTEKDIPQANQIDENHQRRYLIDGTMRTWEGPMQDVLSPVCIREGDRAYQKRLGSYPLLTKIEALDALNAASRAYDHGQGPWPTMPVEGRIEHIQNFVNLMALRREDVVNTLMWEIGKSRTDSEKEFDRTVQYCKDTVEALKELDRKSSTFLEEGGLLAQVRRAPLGRVLCMGPFNYPLNETYTTLIPALAMGNTVVFKPAKYGVLLHEPLLEAYQLSFPQGVINTIYGDGREVIGPLMDSGDVDVLAFIGSTKVANILKKQHPRPNRLRSVLGLGAKNPAIVLEDADMESTIDECVQGSLSYNGQRCTALKILFVQRSIADEFVGRFSEKVDGLKYGMPWEKGVVITPLPEEGKVGYLEKMVADAKAHGAQIMNPKGGKSAQTFFYPAVMFPVNERMTLYHEEQFGPIVPIVPFDDINEPLDYMIKSDLGQQASIFGNDPTQVGKLVDVLVNQVCRVNLNSQCQRGPDTFPFTGRKDSAEGTLSVSDALRVFSIRTLAAAKATPQNKLLLSRMLREKTSDFLSTDYLF